MRLGTRRLTAEIPKELHLWLKLTALIAHTTPTKLIVGWLHAKRTEIGEPAIASYVAHETAAPPIESPPVLDVDSAGAQPES